MSTRCAGAVVLALAGTAMGVPPSGPVSFTGIGQAPGGTATNVTAISADGQVVTGTARIGGRDMVMRWSAATGAESLGELPDATFSVANDISLDGSVIVGQSAFRAFRWTRATGMVDLGTLTGSDGFAAAWGVSSDGDTVLGTSAAADGFDVFRWTNGQGMSSEGLFDGAAISGNADVFVATEFFNSDEVGLHAFRVADGQFPQDLGDLPGGTFSNQPTAISTGGDIVVGLSRAWPNPTSINEGIDQAYIWRDETGIRPLGAFGPIWTSRADDVSDDAGVVVGTGMTPNGPEAAIWIDGGPIQRLETYLLSIGVTQAAGWSLTGATSVSADGMVIAGTGINPNGVTEGWVVRIPSPSPIGLIGVVIGGWMGRRRR